MMSAPKLCSEFYLEPDVVELAQSLLGKVLCTNIGDKRTSGIIIETEAYNGIHDKACHAYANKRTKRTKTMYANGGISYVYLCYGIHHLFNVVTSHADDPKAVLIRAVSPLEGVEVMEERRNNKKPVAAGPGTTSQALGITTELNGASLVGDKIWIEDRNISPVSIKSGPRIGVDYAEEDALLPYRFIASI